MPFGGDTVAKWPTPILDARNAVRQGLPFSVFESVATHLHVTEDQPFSFDPRLFRDA
jgi:hypothetical protein